MSCVKKTDEFTTTCDNFFNLVKKLQKGATIEASNAGIGRVIVALNCVSFLTPDVASKSDVRHDIDCLLVRQPDAMSGIVF